MKGILFFSALLLYAAPLRATSYICSTAANDQDLVHIRYKYGTLKLDASKTTQEVSEICHDRAAGCFVYCGFAGSISVKDKVFQAQGVKCVVPEVEVTYDFSGRVIYVTKEYTPCGTRAVFRHEMQHFMIWKTATEWFLKDLRFSLNQAVRKQAVICPKKGVCSANSYDVLKSVKAQVEKRWININRKQQDLLDEVDHDMDNDVNYTVCAPYSLEVKLF